MSDKISGRMIRANYLTDFKGSILLEDHIAQEYNVCFPDASLLAQALAWVHLCEQTALSKAKQRGEEEGALFVMLAGVYVLMRVVFILTNYSATAN